MRVLVAYASQFGSTAEIAERIAFRLRTAQLDPDVVNLADPYTAVEVDAYDAYVIGSAVHGGHWLEPAADFVRANLVRLSRWPVWLFSSGPLGDTAVRSPQPDPHEVNEFRHQIELRGHVVFAGAFDRASADFSEMGVIERVVVQRFLPDGDWRNWPAIDRFGDEVAAGLQRLAVPA